jgi:hypothetical protein
MYVGKFRAPVMHVLDLISNTQNALQRARKLLNLALGQCTRAHLCKHALEDSGAVAQKISHFVQCQTQKICYSFLPWEMSVHVRPLRYTCLNERSMRQNQ